MTHIKCHRTGELWQLYCEACSTPLDLVSSKTIVALSQDWQRVLCFDCDGRADEIPPILASNTIPYVLIIDGKKYRVDPWQELLTFRKRLDLWTSKFEAVIQTNTERIKRLCGG